MKKNKNQTSTKTELENTFIKTAENEERKFSYINPAIQKDLETRYMFWNSFGEILGRTLVLVAKFLSLIITILFFINLEENIKVIATYKSYILTGLIILEILISFLYVLPQVLVKKTNVLKAWGIVYVYFGILYFIFWESAVIVSSIFISIYFSQDNNSLVIGTTVIIFLVSVFVVSILLIIGGSIIISKADDVQKQLTIE